ncbi:uncharacterized protein [Anabrus simplex]|uniref:uncharacterized protein n=1 Tax=Anabrus simplex TaxID=316456 RepID=UPI0035A3B3C3
MDNCGDEEGMETNLELITAKRRTKSLVDDCAIQGDDQQTLMAECRTCNIRLKPQVTDGVYLTCFECRSMPVDQTCKLGVHDKESPKYRVSASFFEVLVRNTTDTHESPAEEEEERNEEFIAF